MGNLRGVLVKDVITAWNRYVEFLYCIGGIRCPTKVYFSLSTLAGILGRTFSITFTNANVMVGVFFLKVFCLPSKYGNRKDNARDFVMISRSQLIF